MKRSQVLGMLAGCLLVASCGKGSGESAPAAKEEAPAPPVEARTTPGAEPSRAEPAPTPVEARPAPADTAAAVLAQVAKDADCANPRARTVDALAANLDPTKLQRWCKALGWERGQAADLAAGPTIHLGFSAALHAGQPLEGALTGAKLATMVVANEGDKVRIAISPITPDDDDEKAVLARTEAAILDYLAGQQADVPVEKALHDHLLTLPGKPDHRVATRGPSGWQLAAEGPVLAAELRRVGDLWIAVERDGDKGIWLSIFTDKLRPFTR